MINANEFRVGNAVLLDGKHVAIINTIGEFSVSTVNPENKHSDGSTGDYWRTDTDWINPIPLTEEILVKCGFVTCTSPFRDQPAYVIGNDASRLVWCKNEIYKPTSQGLYHFLRLTDSDWLGDGTVNNLHQLQNLYFALTGTEIEYKP